MTRNEAPRRIVCLTEETTETLYLLGEGDRVVGVSAYTERPVEAKEKPAISAFVTACHDKIVALDPDLVLTFSDLQAEICVELVRNGLQVLAFNQRSVAGILDMISMLSRLVGKPERGACLLEKLDAYLAKISASAERFPRRPTVFFEEWPDPLISGIEWVEELVEIAGGTPIFPAMRGKGRAAERIVQAGEVVKESPEVILASWCGRKFDKKTVCAREAWSGIPAVRDGNMFEIDSSVILQPGPAALTEGVGRMHSILADVVGVSVDAELLSTGLEDVVPREAVER